MAVRLPRVSPALHSSIALLVLIVLVTAWSLPIATRMIDAGDYPDHLRTAAAVAAKPHLPAPHFLYFVSVAAVLQAMPGISVRAAGIAVTTGFLVATAIVVWWYLRRIGRDASDPATVWLAIALLVAGPILPPMVLADVFLIGFFVPNPYHNATIVAARPFAVALLACAAAALAWGRFRIQPPVAAAVVFLSAVSKPNYLLCVVPALGFAAAARLIFRRPIGWPVLLAIVVPAVVLVLLMREAYGARGVDVIVAPFAAMRFHTAIDGTLALKLLASVAFPLAVVLLWPHVLAVHGELAIAWLATIVGLLQAYLLAEAGPRIDHANLMAGASLAVFVLMVASCGAVLARRTAGERYDRVRLTLAGVVFALHLWGGFRHLLVTMMTPSRWLEPLGYVAVATAALWMAVVARQRFTGNWASRGRTPLHTR